MKQRTSKIGWAIFLVFASLLLSSCLFPEEFSSEIEIGKDGTYRFSYDGILTFVPARAEESLSGQLSEKTRMSLEKAAEKMKEDSRFKRVEYVGNSKFRVRYEAEGSLDKPFHFLGKDIRIFSIRPQDDERVVVKGIEMSNKDIAQLTSIGISIDGELTVKTDGTVIEHNASSTPAFFGLLGGYQWKIKSLNDPAPRIVIKLE